MSEMPLTGCDLRVIADAVDAVDATELASQGVLGRVEVYRPDGDEQIGWVARFDDAEPGMGWGFVPKEGDA